MERVIFSFNIVCFWSILKTEKVLKNEKVFIYLQV